MSRLVLVFLPMILIASFVLGERFASCKFTLVYVSKLTYHVKLFRNEYVPRM